MLTRDEMIWGYRYVLGRDPESRNTVESHMAQHADWRYFREALLDSAEFAQIQSTRKLPSKWVISEIFGGTQMIWLDLADAFVSRGCLIDQYEPVESAYVRANLHEGNVFVDVGANIGWFTLLAASIVRDTGHVHAFEPRLPTADYLRRSVALNAMQNIVTVHEAGLGDDTRDYHLGWQRGTTNPGSSCLVEPTLADGLETIPIRLITLDSLDLARVDLLKMDVEGAEMRAVYGARSTIDRHRPLIISELHPRQLVQVSGVTPKQFLQYFRSIGYEAFILDSVRGGEKLNDFPRDWYKELLNVVLAPEEFRDRDRRLAAIGESAALPA